MKHQFRIIGLASCIALAPIAALAQDTGQAGTSLEGTSTLPDSNAPDSSANPFTGAAGADKYYQDNSLAGSPQSNTTGTTGAAGNGSGMGSGVSPSYQATTLPTLGDSTATDTANPFAGAAGANRFYQDNSLTGSMPTTNLGTLGGIGSGATSWATTP